MASIRSKTISKKAPINAPEKIYISKVKGNDQMITPLSQLKELASEQNSYHTIKGEIEGVKHFIYKVKNSPIKNFIKFSSLGMC
jgi:hypothetical protein